MLECNIAYIVNSYFGLEDMSIASNNQQKGIQIVLRKRKKLRVVQNLNSSNYVSFILWDRGQIGIKLGTKHVIDLKLANFT